MTKPTIWIFSLEPLDGRYTKQLHTNLPLILSQAAGDQFKVRQIDGVQRTATVTQGAFLNFSDTNYWKSSQMCRFVELYDAGEVGDHDKIVYTDAWNPTILQVKYMRDLLHRQWQIHALCWAGAHDPTDILGYTMEKPWPLDAERSFFYACDYTYFASHNHRSMFLRNLDIPQQYHGRALRNGFPNTPMVDQCAPYFDLPRSGSLMIWPHRYNDDKQPNIVEDLIKLGVNTVITQKLNLNKEEYYDELGRSSVIFSCSLHENLGISMMEGCLAGAIPIVPDRCSYSEMYNDVFKYPSEWTIDWDHYVRHRDQLLAFINERIVNREQYIPALREQVKFLTEHYLTPRTLVEQLMR